MLENKLIPADDKIQKQLNLEPGAYVVTFHACEQQMESR
mgnify:CR=1 FL=1